MSVRENLLRLRAELDRVQRFPVVIAGVTKFQPLERVREAVGSGLTVLANNYAQDGETLREALKDERVEWHFIGHIQSRKVKTLIDYDCVQSLDRLEIAQALNARVPETLSVLVEVNIGAEPQKSGVSAAALPAFLKELSAMPHLRLRGLMGMPPPLQPVQARRPFFRELRALYERHGAEHGFDCLSMGTSEDYLVAAEEGSTMVRLGTVLFGERPSKTKPPQELPPAIDSGGTASSSGN